MTDVQYEIRETRDVSGGIALALHVEGEQVATARVDGDVLAQMEAQLGSNREEVRAILEEALVRNLKQQLAKVELTRPRAIPPEGLRFVSRYVIRHSAAISAGIVWYDVPSGSTGPEDLVAVVRNKMRFEVHRLLTEASPKAREIIELMK